MGRKFKRASIKDIAALASVSTATVSKVLNNKDDNISEPTRALVKKIADELSYVPNTLAQGLQRNNSRTLGIILPDITNAFQDMTTGAEDETRKSDYGIILARTNGDIEIEKRCIKMLISKMVDGIIYVSSGFKSNHIFLSNSKIPFVAIDRCIDIKCNNGTVFIDNYMAMHDIANIIIQKRCKRVGYITGCASTHPCKERLEGLRDRLAEHQIPLEHIYEGSLNVDTGYVGAYEILSKNPDIDCIACANDLIAIGAINAIHKIGLKIPDEIKVAGFDDTLISKYCSPSLTTVNQNSYSMGMLAAKMLIEHVDIGSELYYIKLDHKIIERETL